MELQPSKNFKMKFSIVLAIVAVAAARPDDDSYYKENFNIDELSNNKSLLQSYCDCFLGVGECTPESSYLKNWIPEAVQNDCRNCSENQKGHLAKFALLVYEQLPEEYAKLKKIYNPERIYEKAFQEFLRKYGH